MPNPTVVEAGVVSIGGAKLNSLLGTPLGVAPMENPGDIDVVLDIDGSSRTPAFTSCLLAERIADGGIAGTAAAVSEFRATTTRAPLAKCVM